MVTSRTAKEKVRILSKTGINARMREKAIRPYALAIGRLNLEWTKLQEWLGQLFLTSLKEHTAIALAIWHSLKNDRTQRDILRISAEKTWKDKELEDIIWLLDKANSLADARNDAIHSPFMLVF